jgi:hypothetical protein
MGIENSAEFMFLAVLSLVLAYAAANWSYRHIEAPFL